MAAIPASEARNLYTSVVVDTYRERIPAPAFLRSFFKVKESVTKYVEIDVQRGTEKVAVDVLRGTEGNRNVFGLGTMHKYEPPYYREYFELTSLDLYDRVFGDADVEAAVFAQFVDDVVEKITALQQKIERAYELQCAQVLETGIVQVSNGDNINYKRKAASLVDKSGTPWTGSVDPYADIELGAAFLRSAGKSQGGIINAIFGGVAWNAFVNNATVKARGPLSNVNFDSLAAPQRSSVGGVLHGRFTSGSYIINAWTYPEVYDNASGVSTPYINPKKLILLPENPRFTMAFAAVPQLPSKNGGRIKKGAFVLSDYVDDRLETHIHDVKSAGLAIPTAIDQMVTMQVVA